MTLEVQIEQLNDSLRVLNDNMVELMRRLGASTEQAPEEPKAKPRKAKPKAEEPEIETKPTGKDTLIEALKQLQTVAGASAVKALLDEHGARNVGSLPTDLYAEVASQAVRCAAAATEEAA